MYPYLFNSGVSSWNVCFFVGVVVSLFLVIINVPKNFSVRKKGIFFCCLLMVYFGILGAKFLFVILHWSVVIRKGYSVFDLLFFSGYASLGGIFGVLIGIVFFCRFRIKKLNFFEVADYVFPYMLLCFSFVRFGCFLNGCCYGKATSSFFGVLSRFSDPGVLCYPTQLFLMFALFLNFFVIRFIYKYGKYNFSGVVFFVGVSIYCFFRFFIEFLRQEHVPFLGFFSLAQIFLVIVFVFSLIYVFCILKCSVKN